MAMPGRSYQSSSGYRYGFNGQEKDLEIFEGVFTAEYWEYDSRIGKRWNRDPVVYPWQSSYATFNNNPVYFSDPSGLEGGPAKNTPDFKGFVTVPHAGTDADPLVTDEVIIPCNCDGQIGGGKGSTPDLPSVATGNLTPIPYNFGSIQESTNGDWISELAKSIRRWESKIENTHERSFGPPIKTNFWGYTSHENGGSKGESFSSPHTSSWLAGTPGAVVYNALRFIPKSGDKVVDLWNEVAGKVSDFADTDPLGPLLNNSNSEEILEKPSEAQQQAMSNESDSIIVTTVTHYKSGKTDTSYIKGKNEQEASRGKGRVVSKKEKQK
jgi:hypothetical protein